MSRHKHNLIVVDPHKNDLAMKAKVFLQVRPGTDGALALGMINLVIEQNLYSRSFVEQHTIGFEELKARVPTQ